MINLIKWIIFYLIYYLKYILNHQNRLSKTILDCLTESVSRVFEDSPDNYNCLTEGMLARQLNCLTEDW